MSWSQERRYFWLIDTIRSAGERGITKEEIFRKWEKASLNEDNEPFRERTFRDHLNAIQLRFNIEIECDRRDYTYRIVDLEDEYGSIKSTLIDAMVLNNAIGEMPAMRNRIVLSQSFSHPNLALLAHALKNGSAVDFRYHKVYDSIPEKRLEYDYRSTIEPYGLFFRGVWFLIGRVEQDNTIHIYSVFNILELKTTDKPYSIPEDFEVNSYCRNYTWVQTRISEAPDILADDGNAFEMTEIDEKYINQY